MKDYQVCEDLRTCYEFNGEKTITKSSKDVTITEQILS